MTGLGGLAVRRAAAGRGPLLALAVLTGLVVACVVGVIGQVEHGVRASVRDVSELAGESGTLVLRTRLVDDGAAQDATVRRLVADAARGAHVDVARSQAADGTDTPFVTWTVSVDATSLDPEDVLRLAAGLPGLESAVKGSDAQSRGLVVSGGLVAAADTLAARAGSFRAVAVVPLLVLGVVGVVGLGRVASQVVASRRRQDALLASRGVSRGQLRTLVGAEAAVTAALGAAVGAVASLLVLRGVVGPVAGIEQRAVVAALVAVVAVTLTTTVRAGRQLEDLQRTEPRGTLAAGSVVTTFALVVVALVATWRISVADDATPDLLAVAAPAALLVSLVMLGVLATGPVLAMLARRAARARGLDRVLALRSAARRHGVRLPALVAGLAVATTVLASAYSGSTAVGGARLASLDAGADLRVTVATSGPVVAADVDPAPGVDAGAVASAAVVVREADVGPETVTLLAARPASLDAVVRDGQPLAPALAGAATSSGPVLGAQGLTIPVTARFEQIPDLDVDFGLTGDPRVLTARVGATAWLVDDEGRFALARGSSVELDAEGPGSTGMLTVSTDLPGTWMVVSLSVTVDEVLSDGSRTYTQVFDGGHVVTIEVGDVSGAEGPVGPPVWELSKSGVDLPTAGRLVSGTTGTWVAPVAEGAARLPGVVDETLARAFDLAVGSKMPLTVAGINVDVVVTEIRDRLPGVESPAVAVDADALRGVQAAMGAAVLRSEEVWLRTAADAAGAPGAARSLAERLVSDGTWLVSASAVATVSAPRGAGVAEAFLTAGVAAVLLALAGLLSTTRAQVSSREGETVALRALGLEPRRQARSRVVELCWVLGAGIVLGAAVGLVMARVATPLLVNAGTGSTGAGSVALDPLPVVVGLVLLVAGAAGILAAYARTVAGQAADRDLREVSA